MKLLNKYARDVFVNYDIHAATDVTGFGLLGHLSEMAGDDFSIIVDSSKVPVLEPALDLANEFLFTTGGQNNRNYLKNIVEFYKDDFAMSEVLFDPQTSGGLLVAVDRDTADQIIEEFKKQNMDIYEIGEVKAKRSYPIIVK